MKKTYISLFWLCLFLNNVWAEGCPGADYEYEGVIKTRGYAVVSSADGYANLREKGNVNSKVIKKLPNGTFLSIWNLNDKRTKWCFDNFLKGYIHLSQLKAISEFPSIPKLHQEEFLTELKNDDVHIVAKTKAFNEKEHTIIKKEEDRNIIDGIPTWQSLPSFEFDYVKIQFKNKPAFFLPKEALIGLFELSSNAPQISAYYDKDNDMLFIYGYISDASIMAEFTWVIKDKQYTERSIDVE